MRAFSCISEKPSNIRGAAHRNICRNKISLIIKVQRTVILWVTANTYTRNLTYKVLLTMAPTIIDDYQ